MSSIRSMTSRGGRMLVHHLTRLSDTLESFGTRLKEAVSSAVGETVSRIVQETVRSILDLPPTHPDLRSRYSDMRPNARPIWSRSEEPDESLWLDEADRYSPGEDDDEFPSRSRAENRPEPSRLPRAIAVGFHTMLCWLRRSVGHFSVLTAASFGLLTAGAAYMGGSWAAVMVGLVGSAYHLLSLADSVQRSAEALAAFGSS